MKATVDQQSGSVTLTGNLWSETFPAAQLRAKLAFYRGLGARKAGKGEAEGPYYPFYAPTIAALEAAATALG
jgi:hypothetical protein